jgi:aryl-alcohol dehydrogenase-like predicted oxidoreductase
MRRIELGNGGPAVSSVALGSWTFAGDKIWGPSDEADSLRVIHAALDRGVTLFDTAPNYGDGRSEELLGKALTGRTDALVASKLKVEGKSEDEIRLSVTESLRRLRRDSLDLLQIHWPAVSSKETTAALQLFERMREEGLIRQIGVCNFGLFDLEETKAAAIVSNQIPYSLFWRVVEDGIADASQAHGMRTIAYTPLQQGLLTGNYRDLESFPEGRKRTRHFSQRRPGIRHSEEGMERETASALKALHRLSHRLGRPLLDLALGFVNSRPFIDVVLLGARNEAQLERSLEAADTTLSQEEMGALEEATEELKDATGGNPDMYMTESRVRFPDGEGQPIRRAGQA